MNTIAAITPSARNGIITLKTGSGLFHHAWMPPGSRETIDAKIISEMPLPMPRWVISSPIHISSTQPAVRQTTIRITRARREVVDHRRARGVALRAEQEDVADRLGGREADGQVARVLRDARLTDLALLLQLLQRRRDDRQQLQDDRGRDVGHDPEREDRDAGQAAAGEQVEEAEDVRAGVVLLDLVDRLGVDARHGDVRAQPVQRQHDAVNAIFFRISATRKALRIVASIAGALP